MSWDKLWATNKKYIDPVAPRHVALDKRALVRVVVEGAVEEIKTLPLHPKNPEVGTKKVAFAPVVFIETIDAQTMALNEVVTFMDWGNAVVTSITRDKHSVCLIYAPTTLLYSRRTLSRSCPSVRLQRTPTTKTPRKSPGLPTPSTSAWFPSPPLSSAL
jgi:hypothetical protein